MIKIDCIGAGAGGLYFAILSKIANPSLKIRVFEKNDINQFPGWGVVLDEDIRDHLIKSDIISANKIFDYLYYWDSINVRYKKYKITSSGYNFACISRKKLIEILRDRAIGLGVELIFNKTISNANESGADLVVISDGVSSSNRDKYKDVFKPVIQYGKNYYIWYGTKKKFADFTFDVQETDNGWIWMQAYQYSNNYSTFIAECDKNIYDYYNFDNRSLQEITNILNEVYKNVLDGYTLETLPKSQKLWRKFVYVECTQWHNGHMVLIGDAAHTAHYSVGSGTKLALLDAICLAKYMFGNTSSVKNSLNGYQEERKMEVEAIQKIAKNSNCWFENLSDFSQLTPQQFCTALLIRTQFKENERIEKEVLDSLLNSGTLAFANKGGATSSSIGDKKFSPLSLLVELEV